MNSDNRLVNSYFNYQYKSYVEIYSNEEKRFINDINNICRECTEGNQIIITNNFTEELHSLHIELISLINLFPSLLYISI